MNNFCKVWLPDALTLYGYYRSHFLISLVTEFLRMNKGVVVVVVCVYVCVSLADSGSVVQRY